jgi:2-C-methyl-D-erythritol 2,4-cyclodiphosphate synthase
VANLDATVIIEEPRIFPYARQMRENISHTLGISPQQINVKATTAEGLGFVGERKGIAAYAVALLSSPK